MPEPTPSISPLPSKGEGAETPPDWADLERRLGRYYNVKGAREAGVSPFEVEAEGNEIAKEWATGAPGHFYNIEGAWEAGVGLDDIAKEAWTGYQSRLHGSIGPAEEPSTWQNIKNAWRASALDQDELDRLSTREQGMGGKLLSTLMTPANLLVTGAVAGQEASNEIGGAAAEGIGRTVGGKGPEIPVLTDFSPVSGFREDTPFIETGKAQAGDVLAAAVGTGIAEGGDPLNWVGPGAGSLARTANFAQKRAAIEAWKKGQQGNVVQRMLNPKPGKFYHQFDPRGVMDTAQGLKAVGQGVVGVPVAFAKGVKEGASGKQFKDLAKDLEAELSAKDKAALKEAKAIGKLPPELQAARQVSADLPKTIEDLDKTTRLQDITEITGKERALAGEAAQVEERELRRSVELLKRNEDLTEEEALAKVIAERTPDEEGFMAPWERLAKAAEEKKTSPIDEAVEQAELMDEAAKANKLSNIETATTDEVFTVGQKPWRKGKEAADAPLREEARTFKKYWNDPDNTLFNSAKYWAGRFLADPSAVIPKIAHEAGRLFDRLNETKQLFYRAVNEAVEGLSETDKTYVALLLDTKPKDWAPLAEYYTKNPQVGIAYEKLRRVLDKLADVEGLKRKERLGDYFPHQFKKEGTKGLVDTESNAVAKVVPARSWLPRETADETGKGLALRNIVEKKSGLGNVFELENALAVRINSGLRKAYFNPMLKIWEPRIERLTPGGKAYAEAYTNKLLGRPGKIWQGVEDALSKVKIGGKQFSLHDLNRWQLGITMNYYRGLLGLALDTAFKNLGQVQNTIAELGFRNTGRAAGRMFGEIFLTPKAAKVFKNSGVMDDYETIVTGAADMLNRGKTWRNFDKILFAPMRFSEYLNRGTAFHAGLIEAYARGKVGKKAVEFAKQMVDKTQFRYGTTNTSPYIQNPFGKLWYQFGSYPMKETQFINEILQDPDKRKIFRMILFHGMVYGGAKATGSELMDAMGYTEVTLPFTGNKRTGKKKRSIMLPTGIFPHLGIYSAPAMRTLASAGLAAGELGYRGEPGSAAQDFINNMANLLPGRRYLEKAYQAQQKASSGMDNKIPRFQEHAVNILKGKGMKSRTYGGKGARAYKAQDVVREMIGVRPRERKGVEPLL